MRQLKVNLGQLTNPKYNQTETVNKINELIETIKSFDEMELKDKYPWDDIINGLENYRERVYLDYDECENCHKLRTRVFHTEDHFHNGEYLGGRSGWLKFCTHCKSYDYIVTECRD